MTAPRDVKSRILARRARFVAAAIATVGVAACGGEVDEPTGGDAAVDARDAANPDTRPEPCLGALPPDAEPDTGPTPCLEPPLDAEPDTGPSPCLDFDPDSGSSD